MSHTRRIATFGTGAALVLAAPAISLASPAASHASPAKSTSLTARAVKKTVAPKHSDKLVITLRSGHTRLAGASADLTLWERAKKDSGATMKWVQVSDATFTDDSDGKYVVTGVVPNDPHPKAGRKDQFRARFSGDTLNGVADRASHSKVFTVVVKPARSSTSS